MYLCHKQLLYGSWRINSYITDKERKLSYQILDELKDTLDKSFLENDLPMLQVQLKDSVAKNTIHRNVFGLNPILCSLQTAAIAVKDIGLKRDSVIAILLHQSVQDGYITLEDIDNRFGKSVAKLSMDSFVYKHFTRKSYYRK